MCTNMPAVSVIRPEKLLAKEFLSELGIEIHPQALRMFVRSRWRMIAPLAHAIHDEPSS